MPPHQAVHEDDGGPIGVVAAQTCPDDLDAVFGEDGEGVRGNTPVMGEEAARSSSQVKRTGDDADRLR